MHQAHSKRVQDTLKTSVLRLAKLQFSGMTHSLRVRKRLFIFGIALKTSALYRYTKRSALLISVLPSCLGRKVSISGRVTNA